MYVTPVELNRYDKNIPDACTKCMESKGTLFHCLWECKYIRAFWEEVRVTTEKVILKQMTLNPLLFLLGLYPERQNFNKIEQTFITDLSLLNAKKMYSVNVEKYSQASCDANKNNIHIET